MPKLIFGMPEVQKRLSSELYDRDKVKDNGAPYITEHAIQRFQERVSKRRLTYNEVWAEISNCLNVNTRRYNYLGVENNEKHGITYHFLGEYRGVQYIALLSYIGSVYTILGIDMEQGDNIKMIEEYMAQYKQAEEKEMVRLERKEAAKQQWLESKKKQAVLSRSAAPVTKGQ